MNSKKIKKALIISICAIFIFTAITSMIVAGNIYHLDHCNDINCPQCSFIHFAIEFANSIKCIFKYIIIELLCFIILFLFLIRNNVLNIKPNSLVEYQVQHNE